MSIELLQQLGSRLRQTQAMCQWERRTARLRETTTKAYTQAPPAQSVPFTGDVIQAATAVSDAQVSLQQAQLRLHRAAVIATGVVPRPDYSQCPRCVVVNIVSALLCNSCGSRLPQPFLASCPVCPQTFSSLPAAISMPQRAGSQGTPSIIADQPLDSSAIR